MDGPTSVCVEESVRKTSTILSIVNIVWFDHCEKLGWEWGEVGEDSDFAFDFVELVPILLLVSGPRRVSLSGCQIPHL